MPVPLSGEHVGGTFERGRKAPMWTERVDAGELFLPRLNVVSANCD